MDKVSYEEFLEQNGTMTYSNVGVSMMPLLKQGRDLFTVRKKGNSRCKKYDVVLYRRPPSSYVLHRIIKVREKDYVILGDNCINKEYGITEDDIIGVMVSYVHNGKEHSTDFIGYRLYSRIWVDFAPVRVSLKKMKIRLRKLLCKR
ncbi:MAG: S24/S26 family peptidase [Ruminococcus sp.]|nr:S24/S26 family peptidase [Ruminococcus sp.]